MAFSQRLCPAPHNWKQLGLAFILSGVIVMAGTQLQIHFWPVVVIYSFLWLIALVCFFKIKLVEKAILWNIWTEIKKLAASSLLRITRSRAP